MTTKKIIRIRKYIWYYINFKNDNIFYFDKVI